jgi:hypothetical protein
MRKGLMVLAVAVVAAVFVGNAVSATPPSLRASACINAASPQQLVVTQTWKNAGPADFGGQYDIVFDFISSLSPFVADTVDNKYLANVGDLVSGSQFDLFNSFIGPSGFVPWNNYIRVDVTYVVGGTTTVSDTILKPKNGWKACK